MPTCAECRYAIMSDYGYSNYTVEGTTFECARRLHPEGSFDRFYGENPKLEWANQCSGYDVGTPLEIDVEHEKMSELTVAEAHVLKVLEATKMLLGET